jgi:protein-disulfide isomerase
MKALTWLAAGLALALAACNQPAGPVAQVAGDMSLGPGNAPVTLIEYAAPSCPYCKQFHDEVFKAIKTKYIDTGKIKFILREFPSHNPPVDIAVYQIGRCAGKDKYFAVIDAAFANQKAIDDAAHGPNGARPELLKIAQANGLSEAQFTSCVSDPAGIQRVQDGRDAAARDGVQSTPTLVLNGTMLGAQDLSAYTVEGLSARIDAALAAPPAKP